MEFSFPPGLRPTEAFVQRVSAALIPGVKRPGREADHSPPRGAEVMTAWSYNSLPSTSSWRGA